MGLNIGTMTEALWSESKVSYAFVERNFNLMKRYWGWEVVWFAYSTANALSVTYIGAAMEAISGVKVDTQYLIMYLLIGTLVWRYLSLVFDAISEMIAWERWEGTIEYTFMAPVSRVTHMFGQTVFAVFYGLFITAVIFAIVSGFFSIDIGGANLIGAVAVLLAGSISFIGIGIMAAVLPLLFPERGAQMTNVVQALLLLVSGVYYPVTVLPNWMQLLAACSPATYALRAMREAMLKGSGWQVLLPDIGILIILGVISIIAGLWVFSKCERYAKRTGRLKRVG